MLELYFYIMDWNKEKENIYKMLVLIIKNSGLSS